MSKPNWRSSSDFDFKTNNGIPDEIIAHNIKSNLSSINEWIQACQCHEDPLILVSGGPSTDFDEIKKLQAKFPLAKVICVKHSYQRLLDHGIIPWGCVIVGPSDISEVSSWGFKRAELLKNAQPPTIFFLISRCSASYYSFLEKKGVKIIGFNLLPEEIFKSLDIDPKNESNHQICQFVGKSTLLLGGSCAAFMTISIGYTLGFRTMHLFGFDANVEITEEEKRTRRKYTGEKYYRVKSNEKVYWTTGELLIMATELQDLFAAHHQHNLNLSFYGKNTFIGSIWESCQPSGLKDYHELDQNLQETIPEMKKLLNSSKDNIQFEHINHPNKNKNILSQENQKNKNPPQQNKSLPQQNNDQEDVCIHLNQVKFDCVDPVPKEQIDANIKYNFTHLKYWIHPAFCHLDQIIVVSGGPSTNFTKIKNMINANPEIKVICVKHAYSELIKHDIIPWGCVIVDTRPIDGISSWGKKRSDLLKDAHPETIFFLLTRTHPSYFDFLEQKKVRTVGFNLLLDELYQALSIEKSPENKNFLLQTILPLGGSCAGVVMINLVVFLGFRYLHLFGYDGNVNIKNKDPNEKYIEVMCRDQEFLVTKELLCVVNEMEQLFQHYAVLNNVKFYFHGRDTLLSNVWKNCPQNDQLRVYESIGSQIEFPPFVNQIQQHTSQSSIKKDSLYFNHVTDTSDHRVVGYSSYQDYQKHQIDANKRKINWIFVNQSCIKMLSEYLKRNVPNLKFGLCHGTRRGMEQQWFHEYLHCEVLGTEISDTATQFPNTIQWDFHEIKGEWIKNIDFIYSNSFDHSYDPEHCLDQWMKCLKQSGICILEWTLTHDVGAANLTDPFGATQNGYRKLIEKKYQLLEILKSHDSSPIVDVSEDRYHKQFVRYFFIIKHKQTIYNQTHN